MTEPKVFISWSSDLSKKIGEALRTCISSCCEGVVPWMSDEIHPGTRWCKEILTQLHKSRMAIICVTPDNIDSSWLAFEAGAIAQRLDQVRVCPFLFGVRPTDLGKSPLVNWQATMALDKDANLRLFKEIRSLPQMGRRRGRKAADSVQPADQLEEAEAFTKYWELLHGRLTQLKSEQFGVDMLPNLYTTLRELRDVGNHLIRTHYVQTFPMFIRDHICPCLRSVEKEVLIACDFPAYGRFSDNNAHAEYRAILNEHRREGRAVRLIVPDREFRKELIGRQFSNDEKQFANLREKDPEFAELLLDFGQAIGEGIECLEQFVEKATDIQEMALRDFAKARKGLAACTVFEAPFVLSLHMWIADSANAVFSLPMLSSDTEEHGIRTHDIGLVRALRSIWQNYRDRSKPFASSGPA